MENVSTGQQKSKMDNIEMNELWPSEILHKLTLFPYKIKFTKKQCDGAYVLNSDSKQSGKIRKIVDFTLGQSSFISILPILDFY